MQYLEHNITFDGKISIPVLTMHTTGDGLVVPENEQAYRSVVRHGGNASLLRQIFVHRAGHCAFTPAETITAARVLLHRLSTGHWTGSATNPASLNKKAAALGPKFNIFESNGTGRPDRAGLHQLHPDAIPAAVQPRQPDSVTR